VLCLPPLDYIVAFVSTGKVLESMPDLLLRLLGQPHTFYALKIFLITKLSEPHQQEIVIDMRELSSVVITKRINHRLGASC